MLQTYGSDDVGSLEDAARVAGVAPATLLKWRAAGEFQEGEFVQLKARRGKGFAYAVRLAAAVRVASDHWTPPRVRTPPATLPMRDVAPNVTPVPPRRANTTRDLRPKDVPALPEEWETVHAFAMRHGMKENWRSMWRDRWRKGQLNVYEGAWWSGNHVVKYALDADGMRAFGDIFMRYDWWRPCEWRTCPFCSSLTVPGEVCTMRSDDVYTERLADVE